jgi:hypothetical protein
VSKNKVQRRLFYLRKAKKRYRKELHIEELPDRNMNSNTVEQKMGVEEFY